MAKTILFFDGTLLERRENMRCHVGIPNLLPGGVFEDPYLDKTFGYPTVYHDGRDGCWRCYYAGVAWASEEWKSRQVNIPATAVSDDGIVWHIDDLTRRVHLEHRRFSHQLFYVEAFDHPDRLWGGCSLGMVYRDDQAADERRRFIGCGHVPFRPTLDGPAPINRAVLFTSPDGLRWELHLETHWHPHGAEGHAKPFWNPPIAAAIRFLPSQVGGCDEWSLLKQLIGRPYSEPELVLEPDARWTHLAPRPMACQCMPMTTTLSAFFGSTTPILPSTPPAGKRRNDRLPPCVQHERNLL